MISFAQICRHHGAHEPDDTTGAALAILCDISQYGGHEKNGADSIRELTVEWLRPGLRHLHLDLDVRSIALDGETKEEFEHRPWNALD